ncbi:hypothetical protein Q1695_008147 [Nippostrongylus brasiliensis]|nr:hypothetical protein Q1695_008147 [Nippostrongylus brasiliensis]
MHFITSLLVATMTLVLCLEEVKKRPKYHGRSSMCCLGYCSRMSGLFVLYGYRFTDGATVEDFTYIGQRKRPATRRHHGQLRRTSARSTPRDEKSPTSADTTEIADAAAVSRQVARYFTPQIDFST